MNKKSVAVPATFLVAALALAALFASMLYGRSSSLVIFDLCMAGCGVGMFGVFTILRIAERRGPT